MFGNLGNLAKIMQQAKDIKANVEKMKTDLANSEYAANDDTNQIQAVVSGDFLVKSIKINPALSNSDTVVLGNMIQQAVNNAMYKARISAQEKMKEITGGLDIPGLV